MKGTLRRALVATAVVALLALAGGGLQTADSAHAAQTLNVKVGGGEPGISVDLFLPSNVRVNVGDTVHWSWGWLEPHTVTFGQPTGDPTEPTHPNAAVIDYDGSQFISSGLTGGPAAKIDIKFTKKGEYSYFCVIHPKMKATVSVVDTADVDNQRSVDSKAGAEYGSALAALKPLVENLAARPTPVTTLGDNSSKYTMVVGGEVSVVSGSVMGFFPPKLKVRVGDTVEWNDSTTTPHNIVMGSPPQADPFEAPPTQRPDGYDGTGNIYSGMLGVGWPAGLSYSLKFTRAGTFEFFCSLHVDQGMKGTIEVEAVTGPRPTGPGTTPPPATTPPTTVPRPPATGSGLATDDGQTASLLAWSLVALACAGLGIRLTTATRRS